MATIKMHNAGVMYAAEAVYGTAVSVTTPLAGKTATVTLNMAHNLGRTVGLGEGRNQNTTSPTYGGFDVAGTIEWEVGDLDVLQFCVGPITGSGTGASPFILNEAAAIGFTTDDIKSFSMEVAANEATDFGYLLQGCVIGTVTLTAAVGDKLRGSFDFTAQTCSQLSAVTTYTPSTVTPWVFQQGDILWGTTPSSIAKVAQIGITLNNNLQLYRSIGSRFIEQPEPGERKYDFTTVLRMTELIATTVATDFLGGLSPATGVDSAVPQNNNELQLQFAEGNASTDRHMTIQLDECYLEAQSMPFEMGGGILEGTYNGFANKAKANDFASWVT
ncbi:hypothetical protein LCGC14_1635150 [marine sediment metagenome]|uniref:Uncharacterized protein n=1 Tax=marine sediment metagenome TaxID=412755 RepID=A0A0F9L0Y8_9ZZZZ